jgi:hypothetical protein
MMLEQAKAGKRVVKVRKIVKRKPKKPKAPANEVVAPSADGNDAA